MRPRAVQDWRGAGAGGSLADVGAAPGGARRGAEARWGDLRAGRGAPGRWAEVWAVRMAQVMAPAPVEEPRGRPAEVREPPAAHRPGQPVPASGIRLRTEA